ncbi:uncharacterized protein LOC120333846 [Styela clava]|uniref:uncharacterized protein LOC120333846 n=1 Tax=Styela clava TaxID=7725 RepID=UPI001939F243|nr:uncharacterized protein LOC120333846 [Styela clava]
MSAWDENIKKVITEAKLNKGLEEIEFVVFTKAGAYCGSAGTSKIEGRLDVESIGKIATAFSDKTDKGKEPIRSGGVKVGTAKYNLINDVEHIVFKNKDCGLVVVDTTKDYIVYGITDKFQLRQGHIIAVCEKCAEWLKSQ